MPTLRELARRDGVRRRPRTAFVLSGGGNLGAIQVGMLKALAEREIVPDVVLGCSVGALNGAGYALAPDLDGVARLEQHWRDNTSHELMPSSRIPSAVQLLRKGASLHSNEGLRRGIERLLGTGRSFDEPPGLVTSCFIANRQRIPRSSLTRFIRTIGVSPIRSRTDSAISVPSSDGCRIEASVMNANYATESSGNRCGACCARCVTSCPADGLTSAKPPTMTVGTVSLPLAIERTTSALSGSSQMLCSTRWIPSWSSWPRSEEQKPHPGRQ